VAKRRPSKSGSQILLMRAMIGEKERSAVMMGIVRMLQGSQSEYLIKLLPMKNKNTALIMIGALIIGLFIGYLIATNLIVNR